MPGDVVEVAQPVSLALGAEPPLGDEQTLPVVEHGIVDGMRRVHWFLPDIEYGAPSGLISTYPRAGTVSSPT
jgi:hypothetical protein